MNTIYTNKLPVAVAEYLKAANRFDAAAAAACFTIDAKVRDEEKDYIGSAAIENWILDTSEKFRPNVIVIKAESRGDTLCLSVEVTGDFPSSPAQLNYEIQLRSEKIERLEIR